MRITILITAAALSLSACGRDFTEQAVIGGGAGAVAGILVSADPLVGAVLGAGANALYCQQNPAICE